MSRRFTKVPQNAFKALQINAGILLTKFDPENPDDFDDADILCATTGGIQINCQPDTEDFAEDVDNAPKNMKEFKELTGWTCDFTFTSLGTSPKLLKMAIGAADINGNKVTPRMTINMTDFVDIWWVGDKADGGMVAIHLFNALSTSGLSLQTTDKGKGQISVTLTGHVSIDAQDIAPMEFYSEDAA